jgi:hypothetical protein
MIPLIIGAATAIAGNRGRKKQEAQEEAFAYNTGLAERDQQARIDATRARIGNVFEGPRRQRQIGDYGARLRAFLGDELGRRKTDTSRNLKFSLARSGLTGSSVQRDKGRRLSEEFVRATVDAERQVQRGMADLRGADSRARSSLEGLALGGLSATEGVRRATTETQGNLAAAGADAYTQGLGDVFADTAATYKTLNERAAQRKGFGYAANRQDLYGRAR